jgi:hypothetical protein
MPITRIVEIAAITNMAGRLRNAPVACRVLSAASYASGEETYWLWTAMPKPLRKLTT